MKQFEQFFVEKMIDDKLYLNSDNNDYGFEDRLYFK